jgi:phosphoribosylformylglycinamidine synthase
LAGELGFDICSQQEYRLDAWLFGESQSRVLVSCKPDGLESLLSLAAQHGIPALQIGTVTGPSVTVNGSDWGAMAELESGYAQALPSRLNA